VERLLMMLPPLLVAEMDWLRRREGGRRPRTLPGLVGSGIGKEEDEGR
jgi:hypothetical protein